MSMEIDPIDWQVRIAVAQARVAEYDDRIMLKPPVPDSGIDLWRGRSRGITGYEAERIRQAATRAKAFEVVNAALEKAVVEVKLPVFDHLKPSIRTIQFHVCQKAGVSIADVVSARRTKTVVKPRHLGMMLAKMLTPNSLPQIGRQFGNRDHTTVLHALQKLEHVEKYVANHVRPEDDLPIWVDVAFQGWEELGLR